VTAHARTADRQRASAVGYAAFCAKPIDTVEFLRTVTRLIS